MKKRFPDATGQELVDKGYISSSYKDQFPSARKATATATDEYFEKKPEPPSTIPPETPPDTPTYTTTERKKKRNFDLNLGRRPKAKTQRRRKPKGLFSTKFSTKCPF